MNYYLQRFSIHSTSAILSFSIVSVRYCFQMSVVSGDITVIPRKLGHLDRLIGSCNVYTISHHGTYIVPDILRSQRSL